MLPDKLANNVLYYGKDEPLPARLQLRAGPLSLIYEDGDVRYIKLGETEVVRRIYIAIRDRNWGTILPVFSNMQVDSGDDHFRISFDVENKRNEIQFSWKGVITGSADGTITYSMDGKALSTFWRNRIGFCVLHPAGIAGSPAAVEHVDGSQEYTNLPVLISPDQPVQPFAELKSMSHQVMPGIWANMRFSGDIFEMEDQRNWTDASYKTFCTPLRLPYPVEIQAGTPVMQSITLSLRYEGGSSALEAATPSKGDLQPLTFTLDTGGSSQPLPSLGLGVASHAQPLTSTEVTRLKALNLGHLRVDLMLSDPSYPALLELASRQAMQVGVPLEVALLVSENGENELRDLRPVLDRIQPPVLRWLVFPAREMFKGGSPTPQVVELARKHLSGWGDGVQLASGTNTDMIFMLRSMPPLSKIDVESFAITAEVHAFDNASLVETLEAQGQAVGTARHVANGLPVIVSPVTLRMRHNPYATGPVPDVPAGELPPQVDVRQMSLFGAGWTAGSIRYLALAGTHSVTYFEISGWRGVIETESGSALPDKFHSLPGCVFPMYHIFADVGEFAGGEVLPVRSNDALAVDGLALRKDGRVRLLVVNFTDQEQVVVVANLPGTGKLRILDETNAASAMCTPETYRTTTEIHIQPMDGKLELKLLPYAIARLDSWYPMIH